MRILVTGATGFIGRSFLPQLVSSSDAHIFALVRQKYRHQAALPASLTRLLSDASCVYADLSNQRQTSQAVNEVCPQYVVHLAAAGVTDPFLKPESALRQNVAGTINLLHACFDGDQNVRQMITARTPGELSLMNPYAASKAAAWSFCQMYARTRNWPIHGAMIFQAYGPGQPAHTLIPAAIAAAHAGRDFPMTTGTQVKDWIHIADVANALIKMIGAPLAPGTTLDIGTGKETSVAEVVQHIYAAVNRSGRPLIGSLPDRPGEAARQRADTAETESLIGWKAELSLSEGLARLMSAPE